MVKYKLFFHEGNILKYYYYASGDINSEPGIIEVNLEEGTIEITKAAPNDFLETFTVENAKSLRNSINESRKENGEQELTEEELPLPKKDIQYYFYGSHATRSIKDKINENTEIPESGMAAWC